MKMRFEFVVDDYENVDAAPLWAAIQDMMDGDKSLAGGYSPAPTTRRELLADLWRHIRATVGLLIWG